MSYIASFMPFTRKQKIRIEKYGKADWLGLSPEANRGQAADLARRRT